MSTVLFPVEVKYGGLPAKRANDFIKCFRDFRYCEEQIWGSIANSAAREIILKNHQELNFDADVLIAMRLDEKVMFIQEGTIYQRIFYIDPEIWDSFDNPNALSHYVEERMAASIINRIGK